MKAIGDFVIRPRDDEDPTCWLVEHADGRPAVEHGEPVHFDTQAEAEKWAQQNRGES